MKNFKDSDYALNKYNMNAIVYKLSDCVVEITLADYLAENPDKTEADFQALKELSDADYLEQWNLDYRKNYKNVPLHSLEETEACSVPSAEFEIIEKASQIEANALRLDLGLRAFATLTETQKRRYLLYHAGGLTMRKVAATEGVCHTKIQKSLKSADKKIKNFLQQLEKGVQNT